MKKGIKFLWIIAFAAIAAVNGGADYIKDQMIYMKVTLEYLMSGGNNSGKNTISGEFPYHFNGDNKLTFNPMKQGNGINVFTPDDEYCPKWTLKEDTKGIFPIGDWSNNDSHFTDENNYYTEWVRFDDKNYSFFSLSNHLYEYAKTYTHEKANSSSGVLIWGGNEYPYKFDKGKLIINPMGRGDGINEFTPDNSRCDKWILDGDSGEIPVGKWLNEYNYYEDENNYFTEWIQFSETEVQFHSEIKYSAEINGTYTIDLDASIIIIERY